MIYTIKMSFFIYSFGYFYNLLWPKSNGHETGLTPGVSDSKLYTGRIEKKIGSAGRIVKPKVRKYGKLPWKWLSLNSKSAFFLFIKEVTGRTSTSGGPHAARGPRVWDRCLTPSASNAYPRISVTLKQKLTPRVRCQTSKESYNAMLLLLLLLLVLWFKLL